VADTRQADRDGGLDYLIFGNVFASSSKPGRPAAGTAGLAGVAAATTLPVLAVGGVTPEHLADVAHAGAAGFAAIGLFSDAAPEAIAGIVARSRTAFDSTHTLS
jgi:thiamine monophosphate synthase